MKGPCYYCTAPTPEIRYLVSGRKVHLCDRCWFDGLTVVQRKRMVSAENAVKAGRLTWTPPSATPAKPSATPAKKAGKSKQNKQREGSCRYCGQDVKAAKPLGAGQRPVCSQCEESIRTAPRPGSAVAPARDERPRCPACGAVVQAIGTGRNRLCLACVETQDLPPQRMSIRPGQPLLPLVPDEVPKSTSVRAWRGGAPGLGKRA